jgi:NAD(P)H-hydrate repair Nnr-like enzyme with NAD(P)H-hydrate epimerase domain
MIDIRTVAEVRAAEDVQFARLPEGALMQRAATGLSVAVLGIISSLRGAVVGAEVVLLVGAGNNGGDALWAGAMLARRGCRVQAVCLTDTHAAGAGACAPPVGTSCGGGDGARRPGSHSGRPRRHAASWASAVRGAAPGRAAWSLQRLMAGIVVAVDVPSGVDADSGVVTGAAVVADVTVTFGALKPGLVVTPGALHSGTVRLVDIGLDFAEAARAYVLEALDVAGWVAEPAPDAYKYRRGVVGVAAGSAAYPEPPALHRCRSARQRRHGAHPRPGRWGGCSGHRALPRHRQDGSDPSDQARVDVWACGPGFPGDRLDSVTVAAVLASSVPVVSTRALTIAAEEPALRESFADRWRRGLLTVLLRMKEFERYSPCVFGERLAAARDAASQWGAVVVLKGARHDRAMVGPSSMRARPTSAARVRATC